MPWKVKSFNKKSVLDWFEMIFWWITGLFYRQTTIPWLWSSFGLLISLSLLYQHSLLRWRVTNGSNHLAAVWCLLHVATSIIVVRNMELGHGGQVCQLAWAPPAALDISWLCSLPPAGDVKVGLDNRRQLGELRRVILGGGGAQGVLQQHFLNGLPHLKQTKVIQRNIWLDICELF